MTTTRTTHIGGPTPLLPAAGVVLTTTAGSGRLGGNARGLQPWVATTVPLW
jgi:hypothetical protein